MKNRLLLPAIVLLMVLSSCSNMRYGYMPKVKAKKQTAVAQNTPEKKNIAAPTTIESKKQPAFSVAANYEIATNTNVTPAATSLTDNTSAEAAPKAIAKKPATTEQAKDLSKILSPKQIKKIKKAQNQAATKDLQKGSWLWYVVVGLVLVLIGAIIPWVLGWIFYVVGVIAIIYGLLMLLGIV